MFQMWQASVVPALVQLGAGQRMLLHHRIKCFGVGESDLEQMLPDLIRRGREPQVGITVSGATITLRITAAGANMDECRQAMQSTIDTIHQCLGIIVFGAEEDELEHAIARLLRERGQTLATVEWGTGGLIAHWLSEMPDPCPQFLGGMTIANEDALSRSLDFPADVLNRHGPQSEALAATLAEQCRRRFACDLALAVGPFPPFDPQSAAPHNVHFAVAMPERTVTASAPFAGHPSILKVRAAKQALNLLRLKLLRSTT
jgi:nicotinamide-nucleotide amidase